MLKDILELLDEELNLPTIPGSTMGGEVFWNDIYEKNGYRVQQNMISKHARILDMEDRRISWGTVNGMMKAVERLI